MQRTYDWKQRVVGGCLVWGIASAFGCGAEPTGDEHAAQAATVTSSTTSTLIAGRVEFRLTRRVDPAAVNARSVRVFHRGAAVEGEVRYDAGTQTIAFAPTRPFDRRYPFTWELSPEIEPLLHPLGPQWISAGVPACPWSWETDADQDGLADCAERPGSFHWGVPIYEFGARPAQRDLFIEIDAMEADPALPHTALREEALERVRRAFLARDYHLHFDAGPRFSDTYPDLARFNLGGGNTVATIASVRWARPTPDCAAGWETWPAADNFIRDYRRVHFQPNRAYSFYYMLFARTVDNATASGRTLHASTNATITFGHAAWTPIFTAPANAVDRLNQIINYQAGTIMHEFGHQLGLREGGNPNEAPADALWGKPNHPSVMSYHYQTSGLPPAMQPYAGERHYLYHGGAGEMCSVTHPIDKAAMPLGPFTHWENFVIDYSDGRLDTLDESHLDETVGLSGAPGLSGPIDWNCNGVIDPAPVQADINDNGRSDDLLRDNNDWRSLVLYHYRWRSSGQPWPNDGLAFACPTP